VFTIFSAHRYRELHCDWLIATLEIMAAAPAELRIPLHRPSAPTDAGELVK
jgi:hypothetical protein